MSAHKLLEIDKQHKIDEAKKPFWSHGFCRAYKHTCVHLQPHCERNLGTHTYTFIHTEICVLFIVVMYLFLNDFIICEYKVQGGSDRTNMKSL